MNSKVTTCWISYRIVATLLIGFVFQGLEQLKAEKLSDKDQAFEYYMIASGASGDLLNESRAKCVDLYQKILANPNTKEVANTNLFDQAVCNSIERTDNAIVDFVKKKKLISKEWNDRIKRLTPPTADQEGVIQMSYGRILYFAWQHDYIKTKTNKQIEQYDSTFLAPLKIAESYVLSGQEKGIKRDDDRQQAQVALRLIRDDIDRANRVVAANRRAGRPGRVQPGAVAITFEGGSLNAIRVFNVDATGNESRQPTSVSPGICSDEWAKKSAGPTGNTSSMDVIISSGENRTAGTYGYEITFLEVLDLRIFSANKVGRRQTFKGTFQIPSGKNNGKLQIKSFSWGDSKLEIWPFWSER